MHLRRTGTSNVKRKLPTHHSNISPSTATRACTTMPRTNFFVAVTLALLTVPLGGVMAAKATKASAATTCPCGYTINATTSHFTTRFETDFLHVSDLSQQAGVWTPQAYNVSPSDANGPFGKAAQLRNVVPNPLASTWDWGGDGQGGGDPGLQFWVRSELVGDMVPMSELVSVQGEILYGSFRIGMKTTPVNGTCGAFFFYFSDSEEIDMEFLSKQQVQTSTTSGRSNGSVNLVIQSPESAQQGYVSPGSPDFKATVLPGFSAAEGYHEYRFDWFPERVDFYADSELLSSMTDNVPDAAGRLHIVHWSNGNAGWSAGPPTQDAVLTVSYVKAYFNTSGDDGHDEGECASGGNERRCVVPDQRTPPDPTGADGNVTGKTFFSQIQFAMRRRRGLGRGRRGLVLWLAACFGQRWRSCSCL